jgi:hypothetical protein
VRDRRRLVRNRGAHGLRERGIEVECFEKSDRAGGNRVLANHEALR